MQGWTVTLAYDTKITDKQLDAFLVNLAAASPIVTGGPGGWDVTVSVEQDSDALIAGEEAARLVRLASSPHGLKADHPTSVEVKTWERHDLDLEAPAYPELVGVAELAVILGVSKQRASQLRQLESFPEPLQELAAGPVWPRPWLDRWIEDWKRKPGRPAKTSTGGGTVRTSSASKRDLRTTRDGRVVSSAKSGRFVTSKPAKEVTPS